MPKYYLLKKEQKGNFVSECHNFNDAKQLKNVAHDIKLLILKELNIKPMYTSELSVKLKLNEQKLYYHVNHMIEAGILKVVDRKEIRGTVAKKLEPVAMNFSCSLSSKWEPLSTIEKKRSVVSSFFDPFVLNGILDADLVVGSPDAHGPLKARARDGHYAIDLAFFLGGMCNIPETFTTSIDVDRKIKAIQKNLILVGGPVANLLVADVNEHLPMKFSDEKPWGIISKRTNKKYSDGTSGIICRIKNPYNPDFHILVLAGISAVGTKSAVIALTRHYNSLFQNYTGQDAWGSVVNGFDMDGDGKIDHIEIEE